MINPFIIMREVEKYFCLPKGAICSDKRSRTWVEARNVAVYLCQKHTRFSSTELGEIFERDHTFALEAVKRIKKQEDLHNIYTKIDTILLQKYGN